MSLQNALSVNNIEFAYQKKARPVLKIANFTMKPGEKVFLRGPSGSGKTTLLGLICGVLVAQSGQVFVSQENMSALASSRRDRFRSDHIGYIFQMFNLLPWLSVIDNVILPCRFSAVRRTKAIKHSGTLENEAKRLLQILGLRENSLCHGPAGHLSVGQQQRVAACRALIGDPELVIADEPTSALDERNREEFLQLLFSQVEKSQAALLFVSHENSLTKNFSRIEDMQELNLCC